MKKKFTIMAICLFVILFISFIFKTNCSSTTVIDKNNCSGDTIDMYINDYNNLPSQLKTSCKHLQFTTDNLSKKFNLSLNGEILAISYGNETYVNISKYNKDTIVHESLHCYDYNHNWISKTSNFMNIYNTYKALIPVTPGNNANAQEFFASSGTLYFSSPDYLKENFSEVYEFYYNLFK